MFLIVDSGSTKATWSVVDRHGTQQHSVTTAGLNPVYADAASIAPIAQTVSSEIANHYKISVIHFYGAGCIAEQQCRTIATALQSMIECPSIHVESDMMGAARALFGTGQGVACILGTGANAAYYDGSSLTAAAYAGGFILGDEGSGAVLGRHLIADWVKRQIPTVLYNLLTDQYSLSYSTVVDHVYHQPYPNRYLASFAPFISAHADHPYIDSLLAAELDAFFSRNIVQYPLTTPLGFVGSIAHHFSTQLHAAAARAGRTITDIQQNPIAALGLYHTATAATRRKGNL